jgi:hypothetical protein
MFIYSQLVKGGLMMHISDNSLSLSLSLPPPDPLAVGSPFLLHSRQSQHHHRRPLSQLILQFNQSCSSGAAPWPPRQWSRWGCVAGHVPPAEFFEFFSSVPSWGILAVESSMSVLTKPTALTPSATDYSYSTTDEYTTPAQP